MTSFPIETVICGTAILLQQLLIGRARPFNNGEESMKKAFLAGAAAFVVFACGAAFAQTTIIIEPDQRARIHDYIVREHVAPVPLQDRVAVGAVLPPSVELVPVPPVWGPNLNRYGYVYWNDRVVLVDPETRQVIDVVA
jgi:hypothetical protein